MQFDFHAHKTIGKDFSYPLEMTNKIEPVISNEARDLSELYHYQIRNSENVEAHHSPSGIDMCVRAFPQTTPYYVISANRPQAIIRYF